MYYIALYYHMPLLLFRIIISMWQEWGEAVNGQLKQEIRAFSGFSVWGKGKYSRVFFCFIQPALDAQLKYFC